MFRRNPICSVTKTRRHSFDAATHQCGCGKWERGHKPESQPVRPRSECQICERTQAMVGNCLGHHGYRRPGCGFITGDCMGVGHEPYPKTDALELYLKAVKSYLERCEAKFSEVPTLQSIDYKFTTRYGRNKQEHKVSVNRGDGYAYNAELRHSIPAFETLEQSMIENLESEIRNAVAEINRVEKRITNAINGESK